MQSAPTAALLIKNGINWSIKNPLPKGRGFFA
jgi:hypothetical protein